jgi:hypothetical protein
MRACITDAIGIISDKKKQLNFKVDAIIVFTDIRKIDNIINLLG